MNLVLLFSTSPKRFYSKLFTIRVVCICKGDRTCQLICFLPYSLTFLPFDTIIFLTFKSILYKPCGTKHYYICRIDLLFIRHQQRRNL